MISIVIAVSFLFTSTCVDEAFAGAYSGRNLAPQSIFSPLQDQEIHDIAMIKYVISSALRSGNVDLLSEKEDRSVSSLGVDLAHEEIDITFLFSESLEHTKAGIRLFPCTYQYDPHGAVKSAEYWCCVSKDELGKPKVTVFTEREKIAQGFKEKLGNSVSASRKEARLIQLALESEGEQDERIRNAISKGEYVVVSEKDFSKTLSCVYSFLNNVSSSLLADFHELVDERQLIIITETDEGGRLNTPHAGSQGIYLPNDPQYVQPEWIIHEIFAKAGFTHEENIVFQGLFKKYMKKLTDNEIDAAEFLEGIALSSDERRLLREASEAAFVMLPAESSTRDYSAEKRRRRIIRSFPGGQQSEYPNILGEVSTILSATVDVEEELDEVAAIIRRGLGLHGVNIGLIDEGRGRLRVVGASTEFNSLMLSLIKKASFDIRRNEAATDYFEDLDDVQIITQEELLSFVFEEGTLIGALLKPLVITIQGYSLGQMIIMPIKDEDGHKIGAIHMTKREDESFKEDEFNLLRTLANNISLGISKNRNYRRYKDIVESSPDSIVTMDKKGRITGCNPETGRMLGCPASELIGEEFSSAGIIEREDLLKMVTLFKGLVRGKRVAPFEISFRRKDGQLRTAFVRPKMLASGEIQVISTDITDQRRAEREYKIFVENALEGVAIIQDGVIKLVNPYWAEVTGYTMDELVGMNILDVVHPDDKEIMGRRYRDRMSGGYVPNHYDFKMLCKDGRVGWVSNSVVMHEWEGRPAILCFSSDVTDRKLAEDEAVRARDFLDSAINAINEPVFVKDEQHRWVLLNDAACEVMGLSREELIGKSDFDLYPEEQAKVFWAKDDEVFTSGNAVINEEAITWNGKEHTVLTSKTVYTDKSTGERYIVGTIHDLTERINTQKTLEKLLGMAERRHKEVEALFDIAAIAHAGEFPLDMSLMEIIKRLKDGFPGMKDLFVKLIVDNKEYLSSDPQEETEWKIEAPIIRGGNETGSIKVFCSNVNPDKGEGLGPFVREQCQFLDAVAKEISSSLDHREASKQLQGYQAKLKRVALQWEETFNATHEMFAILDRDRNIIRANAALAELLGLPAEELMGKNCCELMHSALNMRPENCPFAKICAEGKPATEVFFEPTVSKWFEVSMAPIMGEHGEVANIVHIVRDVTERHYEGMALKMQRDISLAISSSNEVTEMLDKVLNVAMEINAIDCGGIYVVDEITGNLELIAHQGLSPDFVEQTRRYSSSSNNVKLIANGEPKYVSYAQIAEESGSEAKSREGLRALAILPIKSEGRVVGVMNLSSHVLNDIPEEVRDLLSAVITQVGEGIAKRLLEQEHKRSEEKMRLYVEQTPLAVISWDLDFKVMGWNPAAEKIFGYTEEEAIGRHATELIIPESFKGYADGIWKSLLANRGGMRSDNENLTKDGKRIVCEWYNTPLVDSQGKVIGVVSQAMDVTEKRRTTEALQKSEHMYRRLFNWLPVAVIMHDEEGDIVHTNVSAQRLFGYGRHEFDKISLNDIDTAGFAATRSDRYEVQSKKGYWSGQGQHRTKAGRIFASDVLTQKLDDGIIVSVIHDASARVVSVKSEVIASIVHDWNNARQGEKLVLPEVCRRAIEEYPQGSVEVTWKELRTLVASSLQSSQIGAVALDTVKGIDRLHPRKIRLKDIAKYLSDQFRMKIVDTQKELVEENENVIKVMVPEDEAIFVDRKSIERIVNNLVKNANDFSHKGASVSVVIREKVLDESDFDGRFSMPIVEKQGERNFSPGDKVIEIMVSDKGRGMSAEVQAKLGEVRFTTREGKGGSGLGISGSLDLIKRMEGDLELITAEGAGSTFILRFRPAVVNAAEKILMPEGEDAKALKVMVIDDNSAARALIEGHLEEGVGIDPRNIFTPGSFEELEKIATEEGPWDVVVLDQNLGGVRGFGADEELLGTDVIRSYTERGIFSEGTVVIIDSVTADPEDIRKIKEMGIPFVSKESGRDAFLEVFSEAFYEVRPHFTSRAQEVELVEVIEEDYLDMFLAHAEPGDYFSADKGLSTSYYSLLSYRMHSVNNSLGGILGVMDLFASRVSEKNAQAGQEALGVIDSVDENIVLVIEKMMEAIPVDREGNPREKYNSEGSRQERLLVLISELVVLKEALNELEKSVLGIMESYPDLFSDKLKKMFHMSFEELKRFNVTSSSDGLGLSEALRYAYEAAAVFDGMSDILALEDEDILEKDIFAEREEVLSVLPVVLEKIRRAGKHVPGKGSEDKKSLVELKDVDVSPKAVKILIADDEELILDALSMTIWSLMLEEGYVSENIVMDMVSSGEEAIDLVRARGTEYYDMVIVDNDFKGNGRIEGIEAGKTLLEMGFDKDRKSLFLASGAPHPEAETWFTGQLSKPTSRKSITEHIIKPLLEVLKARMESEDDHSVMAAGYIERIENDISDVFNDSSVGLAIFDEYADSTDVNEAFYSISDELNILRGISIFEHAKISVEESAKLAKGTPVFKRIRMGDGEVYVNLTSFVGKNGGIYGYMVQIQTVEAYEKVKEEARLAEKRMSEINKLTRQEKSSILQASSPEKVALVYGGDYRKALRMLGAIGFKGSVVLARDKEELKKALTSGEQFDVLINTTTEDIKKILANLNVKVAIIDDLNDTNTFQNTLLEICA